MDRSSFGLAAVLLMAVMPAAHGQIPADAGQVWKTYDIAPFVQQAGPGSHHHVVDWILQETGYPAWHGESPASLSANAQTLSCFHSADMQVKDPGEVQTTSIHPLVRTHPETGRKALYVGGHVQRFDGMTEEESLPLLDFFLAHAIRPEFTCRVRWQTNTLTFWDNRCTQHFAINDYPAETRVMHRITVCGDKPF